MSLDRRRALMGKRKPHILFNWVPVDGLDKLTITATSGSPNVTLTSSELRVTLPKNINNTTWIKLNPGFSIPSKYKVTVWYGNAPLVGTYNWQIGVTAWFDDRENARAILACNNSATYGKRMGISGTYFPLQSAPSAGKISMEYNKTDGIVKGYLDDNLIGTINYSHSVADNDATVWCNSGFACTIYFKRITIEEVL